MNTVVNFNCPVCHSSVNLWDQVCFSVFATRGVVWFCQNKDIFELMVKKKIFDPHSDRKIIHWACNKCINDGKALIANIENQKFHDCFPYFAYFDESKICKNCHKEYIFEKGEQLHWYENLKFWVQVRPIKCKPCYKLNKVNRKVESKSS